MASVDHSRLSEENLAAVLHGVNDLRLEKKPVASPKSDEVLVEIHHVGICGSDVSCWTKGRVGIMELTNPIVLGHEASGRVMQVGSAVQTLVVGDRVAMEPGYGCRLCEYCKAGQYHVCDKITFMATPPSDGSMCRYMTWPADFCFKLPENVGTLEGALVEPLGVGIHACRKGGISLGHSLLITGAGPIGISCMLAAKAAGVRTVCLTDISEKRLEFAKQMGADHAVLVNRDEESDAMVDRVSRRLGGQWHRAIECTGADACLQTCVKGSQPNGIVVLMGHPGKDYSQTPIQDACFREVQIRGSIRSINSFPTALSMIARKQCKMIEMVTHHVPLEQVIDGFEKAKTGVGIKIIIDCLAKGK